MPRQTLASLLPTSAAPAQVQEPDQHRPEQLLAAVQSARQEASPEAKRDVQQQPSSRPAKRSKTVPTAEERTHYAEFVRKEARLREDQVDALATRARKLSRTKTGTDVRITDNTLIRVAVDLLLTRQNDLKGNTESELRKSVGL